MARAPGRTSGEASYTVQLDKEDERALKAAIARVGPTARVEVRKRLKVVGELVQKSIRSRTPVYAGDKYGGSGRLRATGGVRSGSLTVKSSRHTPGLLKKSTKLRIGRLSVTIYNDAKAVSAKYPGGYRYGKRLEFDPKFKGRFAFFYPGYEAEKAAALAMFQGVLDSVARDFGAK